MGRQYLAGHERDRPPEHLYLAVLENGGPRASLRRKHCSSIVIVLGEA